jgi:hypothetical protein
VGSASIFAGRPTAKKYGERSKLRRRPPEKNRGDWPLTGIPLAWTVRGGTMEIKIAARCW